MDDQSDFPVSTEDQVKHELHEMYLGMTDPETIEKRRIKREREEILANVEVDAGL